MGDDGDRHCHRRQRNDQPGNGVHPAMQEEVGNTGPSTVDQKVGGQAKGSQPESIRAKTFDVLRIHVTGGWANRKGNGHRKVDGLGIAAGA